MSDRHSPLPDTNSRTQGERLERGLDIFAIFGWRIRKPTFWIERVRGGKIGAAVKCRPLVNAYGDLVTSVSDSEMVLKREFYARFWGHNSHQLARLRALFSGVV